MQSLLWEEGDSDFELLLPVLSCHADVRWGCPGCPWISRLLNTLIRDDSLSLSQAIKWLCQFSDSNYCCNCCISQLRSCHQHWLSCQELGWAAHAARAQTLPLPTRSHSLPPGKTTKETFPRPNLTDQWSFSPGMLCISWINRVWRMAWASHHG